MNIAKGKFNNIAEIAEKNNIFCGLIFGENNGLVLELSKDLFKNFTFDLKEIFTEEEILADPEILFSTVTVEDFFAKKKLIKIYNITAKFFTIFEKIYPLLQKKKDDIRLCLVGGEIQSKVKIRNFFEEKDDLLCACCYFDEKEDAKNYITDFLEKKSLKYEPELVQFIAENLYGDRRILKNELEKIHLIYLNNKEKIIAPEDVKDILENQTLEDVFDFIDAFALKDKKSIFIFDKLMNSEEVSMIGVLHLMYRHFQNLFEMVQRIESGNSNVDKELFSVFFKRKPMVKKQLGIWNIENLKKMITFITSCEKSTISYGEDLTRQLLINKIIKGN